MAFYEAIRSGRADIALTALELSTHIHHAGEPFSSILVDIASRDPFHPKETIDAINAWSASQSELAILRDCAREPIAGDSPCRALRV
jgi:hypothetical protein